jgi:carboxyl-terminal processing protease
LLAQGLGRQPFHGNVVILVNEWTNSAAEMAAGFASENKLATIIGRKTPGNVLGAVNIKVGAGYWLRLPVFGWLTSGGLCLEGNGIAPDIPVEVRPEELHVGIDQQLLAATKVSDGATIQAKDHATVTA